MNKTSYKDSGVDIDVADATKRAMAKSLETNDVRVLNRLGAFASLFDARFSEYKHPVLVFKMEEPGSKQKIAFEHGRIESLCQDLINHLINDIAVMGATPLMVQDAIICGKLESETVKRVVAGMAAACKVQGCTLVGGETSEQPGVLSPGTYILAASVIGVVEKEYIVDGHSIKEGDAVLALPSSGLHTNGYSLVRALMAKNQNLVNEKIGNQTFLDLILEPHRCYFNNLKPLIGNPGLHGLAHITGGGIEGNLNRIMPSGFCAEIDLATLKVLPIFKFLREYGDLEIPDMLKTFNMGVGITMVCERASATEFIEKFNHSGLGAYQIGVIRKGTEPIELKGQVKLES